MLARAFAAGVPAGWVVADSAYGRSHAFRRWLEEQGRAYALMVPNTHAVRYEGRRQTAAKLAERLPDTAWRTVGVRVGHAALAAHPTERRGRERARLLPGLRCRGHLGGGAAPRVRRAMADRG